MIKLTRLTGVEIHGHGFMMCPIGVCVVPMTFPVVIDNKYSKQDDGDNLQSQSNDGELKPHVGGIGRHTQGNTGYLSQSDTH